MKIDNLSSFLFCSYRFQFPFYWVFPQILGPEFIQYSSMLLVRKMNLEREEGEITEYEDISSDEEILLRQRIAEIEAINLELACLSDKGGWP